MTLDPSVTAGIELKLLLIRKEALADRQGKGFRVSRAFLMRPDHVVDMEGIPGFQQTLIEAQQAYRIVICPPPQTLSYGLSAGCHRVKLLGMISFSSCPGLASHWPLWRNQFSTVLEGNVRPHLSVVPGVAG